MIGMARQDALGAVELFDQHTACEQMRPCHRSHRQDEICLLADGFVQPVGAAEGEAQILPPAVAPAADTPRQGRTVQGDAGGVEGHQDGAAGHLFEQSSGFAAAAFGGIAGTLFGIVHKGSAIPGMSGIDGLGADGATPTSATPSWMSNLLSSVVPLATSVGTTLVQNRMTTLYPPQTQSVQAQGAQMLPGQSGPNQLSTGPQSILVYPPAPAKSNMPMILIAVGVIGLGAAFMMSKKKRK